MVNGTDPTYDRWRHGFRAYGRRRNDFRGDIMQAWKGAFDAAVADAGDSLAVPTLSVHARTARAALPSKFCLVLWSRGVDEAEFRRHTTDAEPGRNRDEALAVLRYKASQFRRRIARLTAHLDAAGYFALMLWPDGQRKPAGPLVLPAPTGAVDIDAPDRMRMWAYVVIGFLELAHAIVVEGNYGRGLATELQYIEALGLADRVLLFDNNGELYRLDDDRRWPFEQLGQAIAYAASQGVRLTSPQV